MEFHTMKRKDLQALCKKHGIPANLKNVEMADRLASLFEKETEDETKSLLENSIDCEIIARKEGKKVRFSPENEVFEFTQSAKKGRPKKVRMRSQICAQDLQQGGVERRRSRIMAKGITIAGRSENESKTRRFSCSDVTGFEEQKTGENHMKDVLGDPNVEKVSRRSRRFLNDIDVQTNTQERRRSIRLKASDGRVKVSIGDAANPFMGGGTSDGRPLCSTKESKGEIKTKQLERSVVVNNQDGEPVKNKAKKSLIDCKVPRRSKRLGNNLNVLVDKRPVKDVKSDDVEVEKAPKQSMELGKRISRRLIDGQGKKGDKQSQRTSGNDCKDKKPLQSLKRTALCNMVGQAISNSPKRCSVISCEQDRASVDNLKKPEMNDKMQLRVRSTRNSSRHDSFEAPLVVEGNLVEKKTNETLERNRDRSAEPDMSMGILSTQSNQTLKRRLDQYAQFEQEEADIVNMESRGSSKKSKTVNQEVFEDKPQGMIENSPSSFGNTESVIVTENILDSFQKTNTKELDSKLLEGEHAERLERETGLMAAVEEDNEEAELVEGEHAEKLERETGLTAVVEEDKKEAELVVPTDHDLVKDIALTPIAEENTKTNEVTFISTPRSELKGFSSVEVECWKEIHSSKDDAKGLLENEVQVANLHGNFFESNTENISAVEGTNTIKVGSMSVGHCVNLSLEKLLGEYAQLEPEEAESPNVEARGSSKNMKSVNQECIIDKQKGMVEGSPFTSEINATESDMIAENDLGSTPKCSVKISLRRNTRELNSELVERDREEKHEDKEAPLSLFVSLTERTEVSNPEAKLFMETTLSPASVQLAVSNTEAELGVHTGHISVDDIDLTVIAMEDIRTKEKSLISLPRYELKEHSVPKSTEAEAKCWNEIQSIKDDEESSVEKNIQEDQHASFSERNTENNKAGCIVVGDGDLDSLDEVKDDNLEKSEHTKSCERGCKLNALELRRGSPINFTSLSPIKKPNNFTSLSPIKKPNNFTSLSPIKKHISKCFGEDERKALSQALLRNKDYRAFAGSAIFTTRERNLLMEQLSEKRKTPTIYSVAHHNEEAVKSNDVVLTPPKQVCMLGDAGINEEDEKLTATNFPDESDVINTTERYVKLGGSTQTEARYEDENIVVELQDELYFASSKEREFGVGIGRNEENRSAELQHEFGTCTRPDRETVLENSASDGAEMAVHFYEESKSSTGLQRDQPLADSELGKAGQQQINSADKSSLFTSSERQLLSRDSEQEKEIRTAEKAAAESKDESVVLIFSETQPFPEVLGLDEAAKNAEDKAMELKVDRDIFSSAKKHLLLETNRDNITANILVVSDVCTASKGQSLMGDSEPDEAANKDVESPGKSNTPTIQERHLPSGDYGVDGTEMMKENTAVTYEESFVLTSPERRQFLGISEPHSAGKQEQEEVDFKEYKSHHSSSPNFSSKDDNVVLESHVPDLGSRENTITDSSSSMPSKASYSHELNGVQETAGAELIPKGSQAEDVVGLDATQGTPKKIRECSPHVDSVNHYDFDIAGKETIMEAESNISFSSYVPALPADGKSEIIGERSSYLEVPGTCSMVYEESVPSVDTQNQIFDALERLAMTDNNEADELIEATLTLSIQKGCERNLLSNSTCGSSSSGKTCVLAETNDDDHLDSRNTFLKSDRKFLENEETGPIATTFEKAISLTPEEFTVEDNRKEKAADEEIITREATPSPEETLNETPEKENENLTINESVKLSQMQVRRVPNLINRTQVKPDMKENAPHLKTLHNLNLTAPRTSKRQPLQDLMKN